MNLIDNTNEPNDAALVAEVTDTGSPVPASANIPPEDQHYVDAILAMDPIKDVPGVVVVPEGRKFAAPGLEALAPEDRTAVRARMEAAGIAPARQSEREAEFVDAHLRSKLSRIRVLTGLGDGATPYHREQCAIAREYGDLVAEYERYEEEIGRVANYRNEIDPVTGEPRAVPVFAIQGTRRAAYNAHMDDLVRRAALLIKEDGSRGIEGERRRQAALAETVALLKSRDEALAERAEAKRRGAELAREARINKQAESIARLNPSGA